MSKAAYFGIGCGVFLLFIVTMAPASFLVSTIAPALQEKVPALALGASRGRWYKGTVTVKYGSFPAAELSWDLSLIELLATNISSSTTLTGNELDAEFEINANSSGGSVTSLNASIGSAYINAVSVDYGLDLSGTFTLDNGSAEFDQAWLTDLSGDINWSGGIVHIETPEQFHSARLPPLTGKLSLPERIATLDVYSGAGELVSLSIKRDGWSRLAVSYEFIDLAGLPINTGYPQDDGNAFLYEEKVF